jgi:hypothetical protein
MTGSDRSPRSGRAAVREERRRQVRRRNQVLGAGAAVVALVGGGGYAAVAAAGGGDAHDAVRSSEPDDKSNDAGPSVLADQKVLLTPPAVKPLSTGTWIVSGTADGSSSTDHSFVCQPQRFADPAGVRTWVRTFRNPTTKATAVQYVEVSNDAAGAGKAYATIAGWLGQCSTPQLRLVASYTTKGLGSRGLIAVFGQPAGDENKRYRTISVTTVGPATMVLEHDTTGDTTPKPGPILAAANAGLQRICTQLGTPCSKTPTATSSLLPSPDTPAGFMSPIDLPVLDSVRKPWVSVTTTTHTGTGCEKMDLKKAKASAYRSQTYVVPDADVPDEFGLDTTVARFASTGAAKTFVETIRKNVNSCPSTTSNATVRRTGSFDLDTMSGQTWRVSYETGDDKIFTYRIGIVVVGKRSVYVLYPVLRHLDISNSAFVEILTRAGERSTTFQ